MCIKLKSNIKITILDEFYIEIREQTENRNHDEKKAKYNKQLFDISVLYTRIIFDVLLSMQINLILR